MADPPKCNCAQSAPVGRCTILQFRFSEVLAVQLQKAAAEAEYSSLKAIKIEPELASAKAKLRHRWWHACFGGRKAAAEKTKPMEPKVTSCHMPPQTCLAVASLERWKWLPGTGERRILQAGRLQQT